MQSLVFLPCFFQKLSKKNLWGGVCSTPLGKGTDLELQKKLNFWLGSRNILIFTWLKFQEILETLEAQVWWIWVILTENDSLCYQESSCMRGNLVFEIVPIDLLLCYIHVTKGFKIS